MLTKSNAKAFAVLAILIQYEEFREWQVDAYVNGRERGFHIVNYESGRAASFSEYRNSDSIVVYLGNSSDFCMQGHTPSESVYERGKFYPDCGYQVAAECIYEFLSGK